MISPYAESWELQAREVVSTRVPALIEDMKRKVDDEYHAEEISREERNRIFRILCDVCLDC
jgi:hypothetical protein